MKSLWPYGGLVSAAAVPPFIEFSARFARTIILSHLLVPIDLGAAVALAMIFGSCEMLADVGLTQFVIVNAGADRAQAAAAARQIAIVRGAAMSLFIYVLAPWLAVLFGAPGYDGSIRWLAVVPLIASFRSWRPTQVQGEYRYGPEAVCVAIAYIGAVIAVFPAVSWLRDERAMVVSLVVEALVYVLVSHAVLRGERVRRVDPMMRRAALAFGMPLIANGVGLVMLSQADRIVVSGLFGLEALALYSLVVGLATVPMSVLSLVLGKFLIPFTAGSGGDAAEARQNSLIAVWLSFVTAAGYALIVGAVLDVAVPFVYGDRYQVPPALHALITLLVFSRACRIGPTAILIGRQKTRQVTVANLMSGAGLAIGFALGICFRRLEAVMLGILLGDLLSLAAMLKLVGSHLSVGSCLRHLIWLSVAAMLAAMGAAAEVGFGFRALAVASAMFVIVVDIRAAYQTDFRTLPAKS